MSEQEDMNRGFLKDKLGNYQVHPPEEVWTEISGQISNGSKRRGMYILLLATAASFALAISLGIHFFGPELPGEQARSEEVRLEGQMPEGERQEARTEPFLASTPDHGQSSVEEESTDVARQILAGNQEDRDEVEIREPADGKEDRGQVVATDVLNIWPEESIDEPISDTESFAVVTPPDDPEVIGDLAELEQADTTAATLRDPYPIVEQEKKRDPRWMVGAAISPLYSYRDAEAVAMPSNAAESGLLSYSTGVNVSYRRNSRLAFETGIYYNKTGIAIGAPGIKVFSQRTDAMIFGVGSELADITSVSNSVGNIVAHSGDIYLNGYKVSAENGTNDFAGDALEEIQASESGIQQHLDYLEVPFNLRYSLIDRTIELQLVGGLSTNFLVGNSVTIEGSNGTREIGYLSNVNTVNYSTNAGVGMIYHMGSKLNLILEPRFRYFINSVNDETLPATRPYSLGFYTGLSYTF